MSEFVSIRALQTAAAVIGVLHNCKKAFDSIQENLQSSNDASELDGLDGGLIQAMALMLSLNKPLLLAMELCNRQETVSYVQYPVWYTKRVLKKFESFLDIVLEESVQTKVNSKKTHKKEKWFAAVGTYVSRLQTSVNVLNLALSTVKLTLGDTWSISQDPTPCSLKTHAIAESAVNKVISQQCTTIQIACGEFYEWHASSVARKSGKNLNLIMKGFATVWIEQLGGDNESIQILRVQVEQEDDDSDLELKVDENLIVTQLRKKDVDEGTLVDLEEELDPFKIAFEIKGKDIEEGNMHHCVLIFESVGNISCQAFSEIVRIFGEDRGLSDLQRDFEKHGFNSP
uniref:Uncharacterized protein n=1 Tax=Mucochytrium quahogii TaxID=96639 RepID=A0A7S2WT83_9STRA|mmetsp:Transcript_14138/g.23110  ORF Transcript_14138/g.23110 Transcript_14138/m.23110 type:complete len:343 (-) Transcript_14138:818-1846(-)|eukprot:CAMPEP_0203763404 /NCGR_PEP_ID=MMETSP0098-20131031/16139_1 /ASSEMBLY_ACC=CAM_ASM_000208 /TAXON_ID=96639 /ORGANISM=" , Strain NY0313808BC1" /LENGTH=342 /DNA_ID=CAMNT_0050658195 /DNA_START=594 /DNA_END=1622 /DNA_ORIENTATION=-